MSSDSDLIGIPVALGAIVAILAVFAAFFFIGPITGIVVCWQSWSSPVSSWCV
jgi:hypothetical protein